MRVELPPSVLRVEQPDGATLVDHATDRVVRLNAAGDLVLKLLQSGAADEEVSSALARSTGRSEVEAWAATVAVINGLAELGFVELGFVELGFVELGFVELGFVELREPGA